MAYSANLPAPTFDLETWAGNYDAALLPFRLAHIATHCPPLARQCLALAIAATKKGKDVQLYARLHDIARRLGLSGFEKDQEWIARQEEANKRELARLEGELRGYKNNLIRESIRMGQEDLATHLLHTGGPLPDLNNPQSISTAGYNAAFQAFTKMRDYCTTPTHVASMTLRQIYTSVLQAIAAQQAPEGGTAATQFTSCMANASRLRSVGVKEEEMTKLTPIVNATLGLAHLGMGQYRDAANSFLTTAPEYATLGPVHGMDFARSVASGNDLAIAGGLCALATLSREDLLNRVLGGPFRPFLELEPHMRKAITLYTTAKYQACLTTLAHYYSDWSLDIFLGAGAGSPFGSHVDRLFSRIRGRSITAYFSSFSQVSLASLAATFPPLSSAAAASSPQPSMEEEILGMIENGMLDARLDIVNGLLVGPRKDARNATHADAKAAAEEVERTLLLRLHRVNVTLAGLEVPRPKTGWGDPRGEAIRAGNGTF